MSTILRLFEPLKKFLKPPKVVIDNLVFQLHYKVTCGLLLLFTILSGCTQYFGNPITCHIKARKGMFGWAGPLLSLYCWGKGTYTIENKNSTFDYHVDRKPAHPGLGTFHPEVHNKVYHDYYQWVCFWTFFQLICFYLTRMFWKKLEGGNMLFLVNGIKDMEEDKIKEDERVTKLIGAYKYMCSQPKRNNLYANKFLFLEILNFFHVIIQIFMTDYFLSGQFLHYGRRFFNIAGPGEIGAFHKVFPKVTTCDFSKFGPGGDITTLDVICVLPLNIINEKIFLIMWLWFPILAIVSGLSVIYRLVLVLYPSHRPLLMFRMTTLGIKNKKYIREICRDSGYGDWFIIKMLMKNVHSDSFGQFLAKIAEEEKGVKGQKGWKEGEGDFVDLGDGDVTYKYLGDGEWDYGDLGGKMGDEEVDRKMCHDGVDKEMGDGAVGDKGVACGEMFDEGDLDNKNPINEEIEGGNVIEIELNGVRRGVDEMLMSGKRGGWKLHPGEDPYQGDGEGEGSELEDTNQKGNKINPGSRFYSKGRSGFKSGATSGSL